MLVDKQKARKENERFKILLDLVKKANKNQLWYMIYDFENLGFYREDKRQQRSFIIECLQNNYTTELTKYLIHDDVSMRMEKSILKAITK